MNTTNKNDPIRITAAKSRYDLDGSGTTACVVDTGLNSHIPGIASERILYQGNTTKKKSRQSPACIAKDNNHGSYMAMQIASNRSGIGIAHNCELVSLKASSHGLFTINSLEYALLWILKNYKKYKISCINLSFSIDRDDPKIGFNLKHNSDIPRNNRIKKYVRKLTKKRIAIVASAGNDYILAGYQEGMCFPAIIRQLFSVGAIANITSDHIVFDDELLIEHINPFDLVPTCQRLSAAIGGSNATDIFAPGYNLLRLELDNPMRHDRNGYGTSYATAIMTGAILLMQQHYKRQHKKLPTIKTLKQTLKHSARIIQDNNCDVTMPFSDRSEYKPTMQQYLCADIEKAIEHLSNN